MTQKTSRLAKLFTNVILSTSFIFLLACFINTSKNALPNESEQTSSVKLFANQNNEDLEGLIVNKITSATESILIMIYSFTDEPILRNLNKKASEGVKVDVICDAKACPHLQKKLHPKIHLIKRFTKGLMHLKILVIDHKDILIGSANFTKDSFKAHSNLILGMTSPELASHLHAKAESFDATGKSALFPHQNFTIENQQIEMWFPSDEPQAVHKIKELIRSAKKTIKVAMFTWTRFDVAKEIIEAKSRGVKVEVALDRTSARGASAKVAMLLETGKIPTGVNKGPGLLHHKFMLIDDTILVNGSANWTKAAFTENDDCFVVIHKLNDSQKLLMKSLWEKVQEDCGLHR